MVIQRLSDLLFRRVVDADGKPLGHVFEVRCRANGECRVTELIYGSRGLLESVGLKEPDMKHVNWEQVLQVSEHEIKLRDSRDANAREH